MDHTVEFPHDPVLVELKTFSTAAETCGIPCCMLS